MSVVEAALPKVDMGLFEAIMPKIDMGAFEAAIPRIGGNPLEATLPKFDTSLIEGVFPKFDGDVLEAIIPNVDMGVFEALMPKIDMGAFEAVLPNMDVALLDTVRAQLDRSLLEPDWLESLPTSEGAEPIDFVAGAVLLLAIVLYLGLREETVAMARGVLESLWSAWVLHWHVANSSPQGGLAVLLADYAALRAIRAASGTSRDVNEGH